MTHPFGVIKDLATDTVKTGVSLPARVAARTYGVAKVAASAGVRVLKETRQDPAPSQPATTTAPAPVNVVEELGLDPAPVDTTTASQPITSIDAQADPTSVEVTPADVSKRVSPPDVQ